MQTRQLILPRPLAGATLQFSLLSPALLFVVLAFAVTPCGGPRPWAHLPQVPGGELVDSSPDDLWITLQGDGSRFLDSKWYPHDRELSSTLRAVAARKPHLRAIVRLERHLPFGSVRRVLSMLRDAGITRIVLVSWEGYPYELMPFFRGAA